MFWVLESTKERCDQQTAAAVLPASYFVSGRKASVGNEVTEYAKKDMEKYMGFFSPTCFTSFDTEVGRRSE